ncbi:oplophorus-luciferin 2-monooxygenase non-catalytic subunit-like [Panonychus citri]|uniref:oplophorus-luciferin 2-monooxygenase non-catalytic subunit-like n=1 Tax=Panonychus citri TaxID=50023 RepID=UPI002307F2B1|nr:oplophorus-luciferin 2-monooxygenase non-catalytic subunit-like [Panonychus citri]
MLVKMLMMIFNPRESSLPNIFPITLTMLTLISPSNINCQFDEGYYTSDYAIKCPPEREIAPCKCNNSSGEMECYGVKINDCSVRQVFSQLANYYVNTAERHVKSLKLYKTELTHMAEDILGDMSLEAIDLNGNQNISLTRIHRTSLVKSKETLKSFKFSGLSEASWITKEENDGSIFEIVDSFNQLAIFWVTDASIPKIQRSAFGRVELPRLTSVQLARDEIEDLGDYAFYRLPNLTSLSIRDNLISRLTNHTFAFEKSSDELLTLDLRGNLLQMQNIDKDAFTRLRRPVHLNLEYNLIEYLDEDVFTPILSNVRSTISVNKNPIKCDCRMQWLKRDDHNYMDRVEGLVCPEATELWYFTVEDLLNECNETYRLEQLALSSSHLIKQSTKLLSILIILLIIHPIFTLN